MENLKSNRIRKIKDKNKNNLDEIIANAIGNTIRYSLDDEYREKCFTLLNVSNTYDCQESIREHFFSLMTPTNLCGSSNNRELPNENFHSDRSLNCFEDENKKREMKATSSNKQQAIRGGSSLKNIEKRESYKEMNNPRLTSEIWQLTSRCLSKGNDSEFF
ncbi:hypothetical protein O3M35_000319 [Rhynocoris fuscipes]|uniref:Uncharacterized protein n=1 Tax=Rhynocoris fuscipes TaxID=488301 RepID=A0AAW1DLQ2_9HEMI